MDPGFRFAAPGWRGEVAISARDQLEKPIKQALAPQDEVEDEKNLVQFMHIMECNNFLILNPTFLAALI